MIARSRFSAETHVTRRLLVSVTGIFAGLVVLCVLAGAFQSKSAVYLPIALGFAAVLFNMFPPRATVITGADGVAVRFMGRETFLAAATLTHVDSFADGVRIHQQSGATRWSVRLYTGPKEDVGALTREIRAIIGRGPLAAAALPARGDKAVADWTRELRALSSGSADYRAAVVTRDALFAVVESGEAAPVERVAAAVALSTALAPDERARLERAAHSSAFSIVRDGLLRVASASVDADDHALEEALAEAEARSKEA